MAYNTRSKGEAFDIIFEEPKKRGHKLQRTPVKSIETPCQLQETYTKQPEKPCSVKNLMNDFDNKSVISQFSVKSKASSTKSRHNEAKADMQQSEKEYHELSLQALEVKMQIKKLEMEAKATEARILEEQMEQERIEQEKIESESQKSQVRVQQWLNNNDNGNAQQSTPKQQVENEQNISKDRVLIEAFKALNSRQVKDLPTFSGDLLEWPNFFSEFNRSTKDYNISDTDNLRRLERALKSNAREAVKGLLNSPRNVQIIINMLETNFGQPQWVIMSLLEKAKNLNPVRESLESYREFFNNLIGIVNGLKNIGSESSLSSPELIATLVDKLPSHTRTMWGRQVTMMQDKNEQYSVEDFCDWFYQELRVQYATYNPAREKYKPTNKSFNPQARNGKQNQPVFLQQTATKECCVCGTNHESMLECHKFAKLPIQKRRQIARDNLMCFLCLKPGHGVKNCASYGSVKCTICNCNHHDILHADDLRKRSQQYTQTERVQLQIVENEISSSESEQEESESFEETQPTEFNLTNILPNNCLLRVAKIKLRGPGGIVETHAIFDEGSTTSMIDESVAKKLKLTGTISPITYRWTNGIVRYEPKSAIVQLEISGNNGKFYPFKNVRTAENLNLPSQKIQIGKIIDEYPYIEKNILEAVNGAKPMVLVGSNNAGLIVPLQTIQYKIDGLQLVKCHLGKTVHGNIFEEQEPPTGPIHVFCQFFEINETSQMYHSSFIEDSRLTDIVKENFTLENYGIVDKERLSLEDARAIEIMESTIKKIDEGYEIGQLYKYPDMPMPTKASYTVALKRLEHVEKRMDKDPSFADAYIEKIKDYLRKGYARKLEGEEKKETSKSFYLPHFGVYNANKPGKFRWVMDAKAKCGRYSLNDLLLQGPDFVPNLAAVIWRARRKPIAFIADIQEMFHRIRIRREDQESQRFLFRDMDRNREPDIYIMQAEIFGAKSSPSMAQYVKNENAKRSEDQFPGVTRPIKRQHYVDDYFDSVDTEEEAIKTIEMVDAVHKQGNFILLKFNTNSKKVLMSIPAERRAPDCETKNTTRVLGLLWDTSTDEILFDLNFIEFSRQVVSEEKVPTKRQLLSFMMSIYDPIGFLLPLTIKLKLIHQDMWRQNLEWEQKLTPKIFERVQNWVKEANEIGIVKIPRWYFPGSKPYSEVELHTFCDASDKAYSACCYLRLTEGDKYYVSFIQGKGKVAPLKHVTVPRLELQAAVLGCQLAKTIEEEIDLVITKRFFWTDSKIVLCWLNSTERLNAFVGARITKIQESSELTEWNWLASEHNVADFATKELPNTDLSHSSEWISGPSFLYEQQQNWPNQILSNEMNEEENILFLAEINTDVSVLLVTTPIESRSLPKAENFSEYSRLINSTVTVLKAIPKLASKLFTNKSNKCTTEFLQLSLVEQRNYVENIWIKAIQAEAFSQEIHDLERTGSVKSTSMLHNLSPILHDGIVRVDGRINCDALTFDEQNPIILPKSNYFVYLLVRHFHRRNAHQGHETVLNNLRQRFWIIGARSVLKRVKAVCAFCAAKRATPNVVRMGNLPVARITSHNPTFTFTGVDHFGPIQVTEYRKTVKVWGLLFTCLTTRAIHIEVVNSLDTSSTIMAIKRFSNLRGRPKQMYSDCGTSFVGADNELKKFIKSFDHDAMTKAMADLANIEWNFNPPASPHMGGAWERMVGLSKTVLKSLKAMTHEQSVSRESLHTAITHVINVVNDRPLAHVSIDPLEPTRLTPNGILLGRNNDNNFPIKYEETFNLKRGHWTQAEVLADRWWNRWVKEIRPQMVRRTKWLDDKGDPYLKVGDLVYVVDENLPRGAWPKGLIVKVFPGQDKRIRVVEVKTSNGSTYIKPFTKIAKIKLLAGPEDVPDQS